MTRHAEWRGEESFAFLHRSDFFNSDGERERRCGRTEAQDSLGEDSSMLMLSIRERRCTISWGEWEESEDLLDLEELELLLLELRWDE